MLCCREAASLPACRRAWRFFKVPAAFSTSSASQTVSKMPLEFSPAHGGVGLVLVGTAIVHVSNF